MSENFAPQVRFENNRKNEAFTVSELLVSTVILGILMGVTSMSLSGAFQNYEENTQTAQLGQSARSIMERMMREIRSASDVHSFYNYLEIIPNAGSGNPDRIQYILFDGVLYYRTVTDGKTTTCVMLKKTDDVTIHGFTSTICIGSDENGDFVSLVTVNLKFKTAGQTQPVSASACPRINRRRS